MSRKTPPELLILGGGAVTGEYYLPALRMLGWARGATVVDLSLSSLRELRRRFPEVKTEKADFRHLSDRRFSKNHFEAAVVALPNWLHEEAVLQMLGEGLHVLCEKPLVLTQPGCLRLAEAARKASRVLMVNMVRRRLPSMTALREGFKRGLLGELIGVDIEDGEAYAWRSDSGAFFKKENGGILADMGVHYLDLIESLVGELSPVRYEDDFRGGVEANARFHLKTRQGIPVRIALSRTRKLRNTVLFTGSQGELVVGKNDFESCRWRSAQTGDDIPLHAEEPFSVAGWSPTLESCFAQQLLDFLQYAQGGENPVVSSQQAAPTIALIEWAYRQRRTAAGFSSSRKAPSLSPPLAPAPAVVTGGTGFIGSNLVQRLFELGFSQVTVPVRNYRTCAEVGRFPIALPRVDLLQYDQVRSVLKGARWVFHCAYGRDGPSVARVTVQGTRNIIEAAIEAGCEGVVVLSTVAVFGYPPDSTVDESWPYHPALGVYGASKARMEGWCLERARDSGSTRIVVLNPTCVYGPGGKTYSIMPVQMAKAGTFCWIVQGRGTANYTYVDDLVEAMLKAAVCKEAHGRRFIINGGSTSWGIFLSPILGPWADRLPSFSRQELLNLQKQLPPPSWPSVLKRTPLFQAGREMVERIAPTLISLLRRSQQVGTAKGPAVSSAPAIPPLWLADLFGPASASFSSESARRVLHWLPQVDLSTGQEKTVEWLRYMGLL